MGAKQHRHEQDLGLIDAGGRFYDPLFGVFLSADPISPLGGSSPRMNRYAYVGYDPVNFVDPSGLALRDVWNDIAHYAGQAWGVVFVGPTNALFTGRWETSWDDATTFGVFQGLFTALAGFVCGAAGGPLLAAACVGYASGLLTKARGGDFFEGAALGAASSFIGFGAGALAGMGAQSLGASSTQIILSEAGSAYGANLGFQAITGSDITWAGAIANGVASGLLAWHRVGQQDAATAQLVGQASGEAAGASSDLVAGITRTHIEFREALSQLAAMGSGPDLRVACSPFCGTVLNPFHDFPEGFTNSYLEGTEFSISLIFTAGELAQLSALLRAAKIQSTLMALRTASEAYKGTTRLGHALSKHAGRNPEIWGKVAGNPSTWHKQAMQHFRDIFRGPGEFQRVTNSHGTTFLQKMLPDGRGLRLQLDFTFKGFLD